MEKPSKKGDFEAPVLVQPREGLPEGTPGPGEAPGRAGSAPGRSRAGGGPRGKQQLGKDIEGLKAVIPLCNRRYSAKLIEGKNVTRAVA